ncbi:protein AHC1 [Echria macrotheca]|uniref:Protein AHC1 n=1 Tax=Echria macrotheca TaxID=438768 RepID=A0AAJ0B360_9PEZI|nr:protein AHC1 [Echria macrotheca]
MSRSMFRFWASDSRGSEKSAEDSALQGQTQAIAPGASEPPQPSPKRRRPVSVETDYQTSKRTKTEQNGGLPSPVSAFADSDEASGLLKSNPAPDLESARDVIEYQFGLEILLKHDELRLINQELAKCQVALEQLRRCHLIPYPVQCPTPSQMLDISSGKGPAWQTKPGQPVPKWAPPFGVVEGPYARHYAKWLIPDPAFDGTVPDVPGFVEAGRSKSSISEGRTTRNSMDVGNTGKQRPVRGAGGQRLHALSSGYPQPKDKPAPCVLKRSDGATVKLVCIDCQRWDFSSTQGFINHCRIAHRRDFKSHDEAAVHCGHPIEVDESGGIVGDDNKTAGAATSGLVHPLARNEPGTERQAYQALASRVRASLKLFEAGKLPGVRSIPRAKTAKRTGLVASADTPYLSQLMQKKKLGGDLNEKVKDAKTKVDLDVLAPGDDSDTDTAPASPAGTTAVMRPRTAASSPPPTPGQRPPSSRGRALSNLDLAPSEESASPELPETPLYDEMDVDLSPNTFAGNTAPSLVSDDGEYDDSDDGSASESSDAMETESVSDVAEITIDEDNDVQEVAPRPITHRCRPSSRAGVNMKKEETRHVTFVTPISKGNAKGRRKQKGMARG